jgi:hypothetical protein
MRTRNQTTTSNPAPAISVLFCIIVVALILSSKDAQDDLVGKQANYCEMRKIYIDSDSEYGWPKLDGYEECK